MDKDLRLGCQKKASNYIYIYFFLTIFYFILQFKVVFIRVNNTVTLFDNFSKEELCKGL